MKNTSKPIIGILGIPLHDSENNNVTALFDDYKNVVVDKGCIPFMIPPLLGIDYFGTKLSEIPPLTDQEKALYREMVDMCDGIIMPGGYRMYNFNQYVLEYAIEKDIPVLGICMGMQLLANVDNQAHCIVANETTVNHKQPNEKYSHKVRILDGTKLSSIINESEIAVNSSHRFHVSKVNNLVVSAYSEDGLIEAVEMPDKRFIVGVQWHPEKLYKFDMNANSLFDSFINECTYEKSSQIKR